MICFKIVDGEHLISFFVSGCRQRDVPRTRTPLPQYLGHFNTCPSNNQFYSEILNSTNGMFLRIGYFLSPIPKQYCKMQWNELQLWLRSVHESLASHFVFYCIAFFSPTVAAIGKDLSSKLVELCKCVPSFQVSSKFQAMCVVVSFLFFAKFSNF